MKIEYFQHNRDSIKSSSIAQIPRSFANIVGRPSLVIFCVPQDSYQKTFVDLNSLVGKASEIFTAGPESPYIGLTQLKKLATFSNCSKEWAQTRFKTISHGEMSYFWEFYFLRTAKWLTYFDEFQRIPDEIKIKLLLSFWHVFARLDKLITTAKARKLKLCSQQTWAMSNGLILDFDRTKVDFSDISNYPTEDLFYFLNSITALDLQPQVLELMELEVSDMEFNFMLAQLTFSYAGKRFQGDILKICDRFQEVLSNDLHEYYVKEMRTPRYSGRLGKIMKINNAIQNDIWKNRPRGELAAIFNVFKVEFSHPEMFIDTGFVRN